MKSKTLHFVNTSVEDKSRILSITIKMPEETDHQIINYPDGARNSIFGKRYFSKRIDRDGLVIKYASLDETQLLGFSEFLVNNKVWKKGFVRMKLKNGVSTGFLIDTKDKDVLEDYFKYLYEESNINLREFISFGVKPQSLYEYWTKNSRGEA